MTRFVLKFLWLDRTIAVSLDQKVGDVTTPLTEFFFWPQNDAWEEMRIFLENNAWISQPDSILLLNKITEVINDWQDHSDLPKKEKLLLKNKYSQCFFVGYD